VLDVRTDKMSVRGMYVSTMRGKTKQESDERNVTDERSQRKSDKRREVTQRKRDHKRG